jgi:DNA ligase-1
MHRLVPSLELARTTRGRKAKVEALAEALRAVAMDDEDLATAARLLSGSALPGEDGAALGVGFALVMTAVSLAYGIADGRLGARARALGDLGDAVGEVATTASSEQRPGLSLGALADLARALTRADGRTAKLDLLRAAYASARPDEAKYLTKVLLGELRIGVREGTVEEAIALAFRRDPREVRAAGLLCTDAGALAVMARDDDLASAELVTGSLVAFMLASPIETVKTPIPLAGAVWEDKLDGVRVQLHAKPGLVRLFARGGGDVTAVFPEVARAFDGVTTEVILDGELLAVADGLRPRPFQALQARLGRKNPDAALLESTPVVLFAFDILRDGESLLGSPWSARRERLEAFFGGGSFAPVAQPTEVHRLDEAVPIDPQIDAAYAAARSRGHEGIVVKDASSSYEAGRRGSAWRKVKRALTTLDVVITRAELGHGKRAGVLSDYTFAVRDGEALVEIGKAYTGLTDAEIAALTEELIAATLEERDGQRFVAPAIVLEIAFDGLQPSKRHRSGFALRFPRIVRIRRDKQPEQVDTLASVRAIFDAAVATGHREGPSAAPPVIQKAAPARKRKARGLAGQLDLFAPAPDRKPP